MAAEGSNTRTLTTKLINRFKVDFEPSGISCTPKGKILVCKRAGYPVRMYTADGVKVMDLPTPPGIQFPRAWDVDCNDKNIFITEVRSSSVLVFNHKGCLVSTIKMNVVGDIGGIAVSNGCMYITEPDSNIVSKYDLFGTQQSFAAVSYALSTPMFVCARGDVVAFSNSTEESVHCVDSRGKEKYFHRALNHPDPLGKLYGVVFDNDNNLFVSDYTEKKICVLSDSGAVLGHIDLPEHQLNRPIGITIDNEGNLLVACEKAGAQLGDVYSVYCKV